MIEYYFILKYHYINIFVLEVSWQNLVQIHFHEKDFREFREKRKF